MLKILQFFPPKYYRRIFGQMRHILTTFNEVKTDKKILEKLLNFDLIEQYPRYFISTHWKHTVMQIINVLYKKKIYEI
jgi:hypothetical protein